VASGPWSVVGKHYRNFAPSARAIGFHISARQ
jgi:hypothetical protein